MNEQALKVTMEKVVAWRRYFHQHPELSFEEKETSAFAAEKLRAFGWNVRTGVGGFGLIADMDGKLPGQRVALRADMDALPIQDAKQCEYASKVPGVMHACGHDGHTSALLGVAELLAHSRDRWTGSVRLLFQPAEEVPPGGATAMIRDGALEGVDVIYGVHLWTPFPSGEVYTVPGPMMAAADEFTVTIRGKGGHGGLPHESVDSVAVGAHFVVNAQSIISRNVDPTSPSVLSIGSIHAGTTFNVIAASCKLQGTVRSFDPQTRTFLKQRVEEVLKATCQMFGAEGHIEYLLGYPPVVNHEAPVERVRDAAIRLFGEDRVKTSPLIMAAEDFSYYLEQVPGCFIFVGAGTDAVWAPHHHPEFDIDEKALETSVRLLYALAAGQDV